MGWAGVTPSGVKTPLIFVEDGVEINQHVYLDMLKDRVVLWVNALPEDEGVTLQQDGATPHASKLVQAWCKDNFKSFWSKEL